MELRLGRHVGNSDPRERRRLALAILIVAAATATLGVGAYATFTDTQSAAPTISTGSVALAPISPSASGNRLSVGASDVAAGDTIQRSVNIKNIGSVSLADVTLTTSATSSSLLDSDTTNGLQVLIEKCSVAWSETGGPPYTYTCGGSTSTVLASRPVVGASLALSNLVLTTNTDNFLRVTLSLPSTAGNTFQNLTSVLDFAFTATQRAGTAQ